MVSTSQLNVSSGSQTATLNTNPRTNRNSPRRTAVRVMSPSGVPFASCARTQRRRLRPARKANSGAPNPAGAHPTPARFSVKWTTTISKMAAVRKMSMDASRMCHDPVVVRRWLDVGCDSPPVAEA